MISREAKKPNDSIGLEGVKKLNDFKYLGEGGWHP